MGAKHTTINPSDLLDNWSLIDSLAGGKYSHSAEIELSPAMYDHFSMQVFEQRHGLKSRGLLAEWQEDEDGAEVAFSVAREGVVITFKRKKK